MIGVSVAPAVHAEGSTRDGEGLEEVIVTAERREQDLQEVPIAATVLSSADLARRGVVNIGDLQQASPSVAINTINRSTFVNIRGVGLALSAPTSSPGVAFYVDGQFIPNEQYIGFAFFDVDAIEVLRGPQGTLTGQNSTGGAIYVRTPEPHLGTASGRLEQTLGNFQTIRSMAAVNAPLGERAAVRVSGLLDRRDSFSTQVGNSPSEPGKVDFWAVRSNLLWEPAAGYRFNLRWEHFDNDSDNNAVTNRSLLPALGPFVVSEDAVSFLRNRGDRYAAEVRVDVTSGVQLRTLLSYQDSLTNDQTDGDRTSTALPVPSNLPTTGANAARFPGRVSWIETTHKIKIGEVNLLSSGDTAFDWVLGGFYLDGKVDLEQLRDNRNTDTFRQSNSSILALADNSTRAVFAQASVQPLESLELIAGARYSRDRQDYTRNNVSDRQESSKVTGRLAANWFVHDDLMFYASASRGYKAGGVNLSSGSRPFGPETNMVYELGAKTTLLEKRLRVNAAVFSSEYEDIQFSSLFNGLPITQNAASATGRGAEIEVTGQFGHLGLNFGAGYLVNEFAESLCLNNTNRPAGDRTRCPLGATATTADDFVPEGRTLPFSPKWTINTGVQYAFLLPGELTLTPRLQYSRVDERTATPFPNANLTAIPAYDVVDARLTLAGTKWSAELYGSNLSDEIYIASQLQDASSAQGGILWGAPRQYGVRATYRFGGD